MATKRKEGRMKPDLDANDNPRECPERPGCWMKKTFCAKCGKCKKKGES